MVKISFNDGSWDSGPTGIGYGDGDDATLLNDMQGSYVSFFARKKFTINDPGHSGATTVIWVDENSGED